MFKSSFRGILLHFSGWTFAVTLVLIVQILLNLPKIGNQQPIPILIYLEYLALSLAWTVPLSFSIAGLFGSSSFYISRVLKKNSQQDKSSNTSAFCKVARFLKPAATLGAFAFLVCLSLMLFIVPAANSRISKLVFTMQTGTMAPNTATSDRVLNLVRLLAKANQLSLESNQGDQHKRTELRLMKNQYMVEAYKILAIPLLGLLLPVLGALLALILSKLRSNQRILLFLFDVFVLIFIWLLLIVGESWGDRGLLSPFASMFLSPIIAALIIAALIKRASEILASAEASL
jgi:lipopolysaccharide export LptBFGC system permease protein LptF